MMIHRQLCYAALLSVAQSTALGCAAANQSSALHAYGVSSQDLKAAVVNALSVPDFQAMAATIGSLSPAQYYADELAGLVPGSFQVDTATIELTDFALTDMALEYDDMNETFASMGDYWAASDFDPAAMTTADVDEALLVSTIYAAGEPLTLPAEGLSLLGVSQQISDLGAIHNLCSRCKDNPLATIEAAFNPETWALVERNPKKFNFAIKTMCEIDKLKGDKLAGVKCNIGRAVVACAGTASQVTTQWQGSSLHLLEASACTPPASGGAARGVGQSAGSAEAAAPTSLPSAGQQLPTF